MVGRWGGGGLKDEVGCEKWKWRIEDRPSEGFGLGWARWTGGGDDDEI